MMSLLKSLGDECNHRRIVVGDLTEKSRARTFGDFDFAGQSEREREEAAPQQHRLDAKVPAGTGLTIIRTMKQVRQLLGQKLSNRDIARKDPVLAARLEQLTIREALSELAGEFVPIHVHGKCLELVAA